MSVLLSGLLDDGTMGSWAVRRQGGHVICQDPDSALFGDMPRHAMQAGACTEVLPLDAIGPALVRLAGRDVPELPSEEKSLTLPRCLLASWPASKSAANLPPTSVPSATAPCSS